MRSSHRELEKKIQKSPDWVDLWENGRPSGTYKMRVRDSFDVRTMSVELSDSLSLLELNEYAEDLFKTGRLGLLNNILCFSASLFDYDYYSSVCVSPSHSLSLPFSLISSLSISLSISLSHSLRLFFSIYLSYSYLTSVSHSLSLSLSLLLSHTLFFSPYSYLSSYIFLSLHSEGRGSSSWNISRKS